MTDRRTRFLKTRWLGAAALVVALLLGMLWISGGSDRAPPPPTSPLIGTWARAIPDIPGTTSILIFESDGRFVSRIIFDDSGKLMQSDDVGSWRTEGTTLVFRDDQQNGLRSFLDRALGNAPPEIRMPILSVADTELSFGGGDDPTVYKRADADQPAEGR